MPAIHQLHLPMQTTPNFLLYYVIITRLARGFRLTRNVNTGRIKLLLLSTYMVVFDEDGLYHDWV